MTPEEAEAFLGGAGKPKGLGEFNADEADAFLGPAGQPIPHTDELDRSVNGDDHAQDHYIANSSLGRVLDAFGQGVRHGWGTGDLGLDPTTDQSMVEGQGILVRAFHDGLVRPAAAVIDAAIRTPMAVIGGVQNVVAQHGIPFLSDEGMPWASGQDLGRALASFPEAFPFGFHGGVPGAEAPHPVRAMLDRARAENIIGQPEPVWRGTAEPVPAANENAPGVGRPAEPVVTTPAPIEPEAAPAPAPAPEPTDVHGVARQIAPETFQEYDALQAHKDGLRQQIAAAQDELRQQAEAQAPGAAEIARLRERLQDTTPRLAKKYQARLAELLPDHEAFLGDDFTMGALTRDTPEIADLRQQLAETDYRMRDLSPEVTEAYRQASERMPAAEEPAAVAPEPATPAPAETSPPEPSQPAETQQEASTPTAETPPEPAPATSPPARPVASIADDVTQKLRAAGRPAVEARASGQVTEALWRTRAEAFEGAKGTPEEMYAREAPDIRAGAARRVREPEMAQRSGAAGKIKLTEDGRSVITLMQHADASTYLHEMGHDWLERMMRDGADPAAPERMRQDAATVRSYLGTPGDLTRAAHEKFARSFERYFMEGRAPSQALAGVFGQFKQWLTEIYRTVAKLRAPITADIRDVFDRMLTTAPEGHVAVIGEALRDEPPPPPPPPAPLFPRTIKEPERLASFLRRHGGVQDTGGDIRQILGGSKYRPGLINGRGMPLDDAARLAHEFGYFPELGEQRPSINHLLDALDGDVRGHEPRYSVHDSAHLEAYHDALAYNGEIDRLADQHGIPTHKDMTRQEFFTALNEHLSAEQWDEEMRSLEEAQAADFGEFAAEAREWHAAQADGGEFNADEFYGIDGPRSAPELEDEYRSQTAAGREGQGVSGGAEPVPAAGSADPGEVGGGQGGRPAGDARRGTRQAEEPRPSDPLGRPDDGLIDKAGNIRLDNLGTPEDVNQVIRDAAAENQDFEPERRGVISDAQVIDLADALGMTPGDLAKRQIGQAFNAEQVMAARKLLVQSATAVRDAMAKAAHGTDEDVLAYGEARARHLMIQAQVSGITAEAGRALRAFRDMGGDGEQVQSLNEFLQQATGKTLFQMRREAQAGALLGTPGQVSKFIGDSAKPTFGDMALEYWINGLISGPATHTTYAIGNALLAVWKAGPETGAAAAIGGVRRLMGGEGGVYPGEVGAGLYAIVKGQRDGVRAAWQAAKTGLTTELPGESVGRTGASLGALPRQAIPGRLGDVVRLPSRGVAAIHSYFRTIGYEQGIAQEAYRTAAREGLDGDAFAARVADLTTNPPADMMERARAEATDQTLMSSGGDFTRKVAELTNTPILGFRLLKVVDPFVKISSNVLSQALLERSPLGILDPEIRGNLMGRNGAVARDQQIARIAVGSSLGAVAVGLAAQGYLTGGGPHDPREAAVWRLSGRQPYSVRIGDTWYEMHRLGPLAMVMGVAADMHEFADAMQTHEMDKLGGLLVTSVAKGLLSESFMRGPADLIQAIEDPDRYGSRYVSSQLATLLPFSTAEGQIARAMDPYARSARGLMDTIKARVPGLSQTLLPRRDIWGEPIANKDDLGMDGLTSIAESRVNNDPVVTALMRLHVFPGAPKRDLNGVQLSGQQYDDLTRIGGRMAKMRLNALVNQPGFDLLPPGVQTKAITGILEHAHQAAGELIKMQNPDLIQQALQHRRDFMLQGRPAK